MFLVGLIALGGILFALLAVCCILTCWKRSHNRRRNVVPGIDILPHKTLTCHGQGKTSTLNGNSSSKCDRRAMINNDTSSETSDDSCQLPYVTKKTGNQVFDGKSGKGQTINKPTSAPPKGMAPLPPNMSRNQKNPSMTVMIPRAKYQHGMLTDAPPIMNHQAMQKTLSAFSQPKPTLTKTESIGSATEAKLLNYLDASPSTTNVSISMSFKQPCLYQ